VSFSPSVPTAVRAPRSRRFVRTVRTRGYTAVELVMAIGIFAVGITGVASMQSVTAGANRQARAVATATAFAQSWQDYLAIDALKWTQAQPITNTTTLSEATATGVVGAWMLPTGVAGFGPGADAVGGYVDHTTNADDAIFCAHIRLTPLIEDTGTTLGGGMLRSEVRVFWPKPGAAWNGGDAYCDPAADIANIGAATDSFNFVY